jgi:hypothetical protein
MTMPTDLADDYLGAMANRIRALTVDTSPKQFGFPARSDDRRLTRYAAIRASDDGRQEAISATLALLLHDGQWAAQRSMWVSFLIELLPASPERILEALPILLRGARGDFKEPGNIREQLPNHPLGSVRIQLGIATDLRAQCLVALGRLWRVTPLESRDTVRSTLLASLTHPDDWARQAAVIGISESTEGDHPAVRDETTAWQRDALIAMLNDYQEAVRDAALEALTRLSSKNSEREGHNGHRH